MRKLILLSIFFALPAFATEAFNIDGVRHTFSTNKEKRITINNVCKTNKKCMALTTLKSLSMSAVAATDLSGGANPGPILCEQQAKGKVVMGLDPNGNQNSFCIFSDGSIIDNGTLTYYGITNDRK